jgi:hypothetical protein
VFRDARAAHAAIEALLPSGAKALPADLFRPEHAEHVASFTRTAIAHMAGVIDGTLRSVQSALAAAPRLAPSANDPAPLTAEARSFLLSELAPGTLVMEAVQAGSQWAEVAIAPMVRFDAGDDRWNAWFVVGEGDVLSLLSVIHDKQDVVYGRLLLEGTGALEQHQALAAKMPGAPHRAEGEARGAIDALSEALRPLLQGLARGEQEAYDAVRPRSGDARAAFTAPVAEAVGASSAAMWAHDAPRVKVRSDQTELHIDLAPVGALAAGHALARPFPGAYEALAQDYLAPDRVWVTWTYTESGAAKGMRYDGLVWLDDHWAWFPKPWRDVQKALESA